MILFVTSFYDVIRKRVKEDGFVCHESNPSFQCARGDILT